ncbi:acyl carrier protein [Streptomyces sp. NPDC014006]|uniref:acyl carrier protein n=1 Tax=Streptomyces sp. NPDC014006 TaxID=3364870 RepID=UPI0036F7FE74
MTSTEVRAAIVQELEARGYAVPESEQDADLIGLGVNSAVLIQILSALEDVFDLDIDLERLFLGPMTVARLEAEITRAAGLRTPSS